MYYTIDIITRNRELTHTNTHTHTHSHTHLHAHTHARTHSHSHSHTHTHTHIHIHTHTHTRTHTHTHKHNLIKHKARQSFTNVREHSLAYFTLGLYSLVQTQRETQHTRADHGSALLTHDSCDPSMSDP